MNGAQSARRHPVFLGLVAVVLLEAATLIAAAVLLLGQLVTGVIEPPGTSALALAVTCALLGLGLGLLGIGAWIGWGRVRGGIVAWQFMQLGASLTAFQGVLGPEPWLPYLLLLPALAGLVLVFSRPVTRAFGQASGSDAQ